MRHPTRLATAAALLAFIAGCADLENQAWEMSNGHRPGLPAPRPPEPPVALPAPLPPEPPLPPAAPIPFAAAPMDTNQAARLLKDDPLALRFVALRRLAEDGLVPPEEALVRKEANMGALLPLTAARKPAAELLQPIPSPDEIAARLRRLAASGRNGPQRAAERAFLMDQLLPAAPGEGVVLTPHDLVSARKVLERLNRLEAAGLVTPDEHSREALAVEGMMADLPETVAPPPPPPEPPKPKKKTTGRSGQRIAGGVSGKLEVIPSPSAVEAPKLPANYQGQVGAHLLSMASAAYGDRAWEALKTQFKAELGELGYKVERADLGELGVTYRLVAGPMDQAASERLCAALRGKGQACMPTPFPK